MNNPPDKKDKAPEHYYNEKFSAMDVRMDNFGNRLGGIEAAQGMMAVSQKNLETTVEKIEKGINQIFSRIESSRVEVDNKPSTIRTDTITKVLGLLLGSSTILGTLMLLYTAPLKASVERAEIDSAKRDAAQQQWIKRLFVTQDGLRAQQLADAERRGQVKVEFEWLRDDIEAQKQDLRLHEERTVPKS